MASPIRSKKDLELVSELSQLILKERELSKRIDQIKTELKAKLTSGTHKAGNFEVTIDECKRESVSNAKIVEIFGQEGFNKVRVVTEYKTVKVREIV
jgi:hypothetical protein